MVRDTSIEAYRRLRDSGVLSRRRWQIYDVAYQFGPATASELAEHLPGRMSRSVGSNIHARLGELREMGAVVELPMRMCRVSGHIALTWDAKLPIPAPGQLSAPKTTHLTWWVAARMDLVVPHDAKMWPKDRKAEAVAWANAHGWRLMRMRMTE